MLFFALWLISGTAPPRAVLPPVNNPDPADATPLLIFLARISGTRFHEASAQDARRRIAAFFSKHLKE